ncbi:hypothetical protein CTEN210_00309 [Chaetoceros tenuissimus]|uniref:peptidylprolyl isomerase n=1 Tax=Chaetoceros tenuissimus TaxID=426638 RepID=A0AAD3CFG6_9STRA|nr:hypothetical protein CTEN210_00309 [Chaetoceros tenuissimus]
MEQISKEPTAAAMEHERPRSKKELRAEKKALLRKQQKATSTKEEITLSKEEKRALIKKQKKMEQKEFKKSQRLQILKEERELKKIRKQKRKNIEVNTKGGATVEKKTKKKRKHTDCSEDQKDRDSAMNVYNSLFNGTKDEITGTTTLAYGVKYKDVIVGKGEEEADDRSLVTVSYKLKGYKGTGAIIDSSKNFTFRVGKGEVIKGWDIGVVGMKVGGRRQLIVPPKAGYGSEDIGAGPGAVLFFDITLLHMR